MLTQKQVEGIITEIKLLADKGLFIKEIAEETGYTYKKVYHFIWKYKIKYKKETTSVFISLPEYVSAAKGLIKKSKTVPCLKVAFDYIHNYVPAKEQDFLLDLLLDKQKEIRDAYKRETSQ